MGFNISLGESSINQYRKEHSTPPCKSEGIPRVSTISLTLDNKQAGAGQDGRTRPARPNYQVRMGTDRKTFAVNSSCSADHEQDWQPHPRLTHTLLYIYIYMMAIHTLWETFVLHSNGTCSTVIIPCQFSQSMRARGYNKIKVPWAGKTLKIERIRLLKQ